jgi:mono/diheme cytochrome c family protein
MRFWLGWVALAGSAWGGTPDPPEFFETRVRPVFAKHCFACHTQSKLGGLEMTSREALQKGGNHGPAIISGDPEHSLLIRVVRHEHERLKMPPTGDKLSDAEIEAISVWIKAGAVWPEAPKPPSSARYAITPEQRSYWAFQPVRQPQPPAVRDTAWARGPIDRFILAKLEAQGLKPAPPADRRTLARRVTFDVTGLPPAPEEVEAFVNDKSPDVVVAIFPPLAGYVVLVERKVLPTCRFGWGRRAWARTGCNSPSPTR